MNVPMRGEEHNRPRVGIPWRTTKEEAANTREKIAYYEESVRRAGGEPVLLSLRDAEALKRQLPQLDAFVLPGSPDDVDPSRYQSVNRGKSNPPDANREATDTAILDHAFAAEKPVLAICYGCQLLNVYLGGSLTQDVQAETGTTTAHRRKDLTPEPKEDPVHPAEFMAGSRLAQLAGGARARVNSSHHQAIEKPGRDLRVTARAPDGIIEGVEWTGGGTWVTGVQWHPERMAGDALADALFRALVEATRAAAARR
ncbi:MAG TPA: gamma-glutamyl-gamma-aminobutyrate hydrolase family protein [Methylomirabilota bacterium]|nr:gamma-glutamyl-gamma-aminobutyrate hydrolase family protein [Methylomirabilota bacterium]